MRSINRSAVAMTDMLALACLGGVGAGSQRGTKRKSKWNPYKKRKIKKATRRQRKGGGA